MAPRDPMGECMKSGRTALGVWANDPVTIALVEALTLQVHALDKRLRSLEGRARPAAAKRRPS